MNMVSFQKQGATGLARMPAYGQGEQYVSDEGLCTDCQTLYNVMRFEGRCPKCKSRNKKIISGREFVVKNILVETEDDTDASE